MEVSTLIKVLFVWFLEGIDVWFFVISWEYNLQDPIVRKIDNKTILNKFVCKGFNAIFVKMMAYFLKHQTYIYFFAKIINQQNYSGSLLIKINF